MSTSLVLRVLWLRARLRRRERWSEAELRQHQRRTLEELRSFTLARSPYYQRLHQGLAGAPLEELPVLTKADLMDNFDQLSTDRDLRLADVQSYLEAGDAERFRGRYWVSATSGSSGRRSIIPNDVREWATVIASYARANEWAGVQAGVRHRTRMPW